MHQKLITAFAALAVVFGGESILSAATITGSITVEASSSLGSGKVEISPDGTWDGNSYRWDLDQAIDIVDDSTGASLGTLQAASMNTDADPVLQLSFNFLGGAANTDITVTSAQLNFPALENPLARASGGIVSVDLNGNGVSYTGKYAGGTKSYTANYNGLAPGGSTFTTLIDNASTGNAFGEASANEGDPAGGGFRNIAGSVSSMSSQFDFTLSAGDFVVGNSVFAVIPEPGTLVLVGLCSVAFAWPRRSRVA